MRAELPAMSRVGVIAVLLTSACIPAPGSETTGRTSSAPETVTPGGRVVYGSSTEAQHLNPIIAADEASQRVTSLLYDPLARPNPKTGEPMPWLGRWTVSADNLTYTWEIDQKASWSDGRPILALDWLARVKASARSKLAAGKGGYGDIEGFTDYAIGKAASIAGIEIDPANPKKFTVRFTRSFCPALLGVFGAGPLPAHVFGPYTVDNDPSKNIDGATENDIPQVVSGPFKFKEWRKGDEIVLTRNDMYWRGAPYLDEFVQKLVPTSTAQAAELKAGRITIGFQQPAEHEDLSKAANLRIYEWPDNGYIAIAWRLNGASVPMLQDKRIRQALAYGLDTAQAVQVILGGHGQRQLSPLPTASWATNSSGLVDYAYDPARAEQLIRDAGYAKGSDGLYRKDGIILGWSMVTGQDDPVHEAYLRFAAEQYGRIGIRITPRSEPSDTLLPKLVTGFADIESAVIGWQLQADPDMFDIWHSTSVASPGKSGLNIVGYNNPQVDRLIEEGRSTNCGRDSRRNTYSQITRILSEDQPFNFSFSQNRILVTDRRLRGIEPGTFSPNATWNMEKWWIGR